jgi:hypothetical protein
MIEAFFDCEVMQDTSMSVEVNTYVSARVACVVPNDEVYDLSRFLGIPDEDLFSVDMSTAFSRPTRIRCLVAAEDLPTLYRSTMQFGSPAVRHKVAAVFKFRSGEYDANGNAKAYEEIPCWLMPPRALHTVATPQDPPPDECDVAGTGLFLVEAVDVKHWWGMVRCDATGLSQIADQHETDWIERDDAAYSMSPGGQAFASDDAAFAYFSGLLPLRPATSVSGSLPGNWTMFNLAAFPQMSAAMAMDLMLAQSARYGILNLSSGVLTLYGFDGHLSAASVIAVEPLIVGGYEATSGSYTTATSPPNDLAELWEGGDNATRADGLRYQFNRLPSKVAVDTAWKAVEGRTWNGVIRSNSTTPNVLSHSEKDYQVLVDVPTVRSRPTIGITGTVTPLFSLPLDTDYLRSATPFSGNVRATLTGATDDVAIRLRNRASAVFGTTVFAGWIEVAQCVALGPATRIRWTLRRRNGERVPITERRLDSDDWITGPNGRLPDDPKDLVIARGNVYARRASVGPLFVDVRSPVRRPFAARITSATRVAASGNGYWRWAYQWEEVQRTADSSLASAFEDVAATQDRNDNGLTAAQRNARNSLEDSNVYVAAANAGNFIAPGYSQADYPAATMDCLPIAVGTVVTMFEDFRDCDQPSTIVVSTVPDYWFSLPNVPKFIC